MKYLRISPKMNLPVDWMTMATVVYGGRGSGKTTLGAVAAEELTKARQRFCAIDLKGDLWGLKSTADGKGEGIPVVIFGGDHADLPLEDGAGKFLGELVAGLEQSVVLDLEHMSKGKQVRFLGEFFSALYDKNREPLLVIADEAQRYAPQKPISPDASICLGAVEDLVKLGRKHGIGVMLLTQRGAGLNKEVSEICDMLVAFRTPGSIDQDRVRDWLGANGFIKKGEDPLVGASGLPTGTALVASAHPDLKVFATVTMRLRETFDSSKTPKVGERRREPKRLAQPEIDGLRVQMAAAIERKKADDPKELRKKIAELEQEIKKVRDAVASTISSALREHTPKAIEKSVVKTEQIARLERTGQHFNNVAIDIKKHAEALIAAVQQAKAPMRDDVFRTAPPLPGSIRSNGRSKDT